MKNYRYYFTVLACAVLALSGCNKEPGFMTGTAIKFGAGTKGESLTKTSYGDIYTENTLNGKDADGKRKQMVEWEDGDLIRIACAQASTTEEGTSTIADYKTTPIGTGATTNADKGNRHEFRATLSLPSSTAKGLRWGSESTAHTFYGVYPSPATNGKSADALTDGGILTGSIPQNQPVTVSGSGPYEASVDMTNLYMVAKKTVAAGTQSIGENEVFLYFTPITTAIEFEVENGMSDALLISSIELISTNYNLSGKFKTELSGISDEYGFDYPGVTANGDNLQTASVTFGNAGHTLAVNQKLTFTIFLLPESNLNDLTFKINKTDGTYIKTALKQVESGSTTPTFIKFDRCKKHFVKGLFVNEGAQWTVCFSPDIASWIENVDDKDLNDPIAAGSPSLVSWDQGGESGDLNLGKPVEYKFSLATGVSSTQTFEPEASNWNVKTLGITSTKDSDAEGWVNEPQGWKIKTVDGNAVTGASYTTSDGLLTVEKDGTNMKVTDNRQKISYGDNAHWTTSGTDWYRAPLSGTIDLSKRDFRTGNTINMTTANCYVVRNAGTYKIPLVYGNGVVGGNSNTQSYAPTIASGGSNGLTPFVNHLGKGIFDPFIENNRNDGGTQFHKNKRLLPASARVVWQDVPDVITITNSGITSHSAGDNACTSANCGYLTFSIAQNKICQCNAVIAVYDGADGTGNILWSWHIWVTNDPVLDNGPVTVNSTYKFLPSPCIGWIEPSFYEKKDDVTIVLEQEDSGETLTVTVKQPATDPDQGKGTYYQWGRKDPMRASSGATGTGPTAIVNGILNPGAFFLTDGNWCSSTYNNLWTGKYSQAPSSAVGEVTGMIKTIYDPSPAGYKVPAPNAFADIENGTSSEITLTAVGYCDRKKGYWGDYISGYWTSVAKSTNAYCYAFPLRNSVTEYLTNKNRSEGLAVRPVQE